MANIKWIGDSREEVSYIIVNFLQNLGRNNISSETLVPKIKSFSHTKTYTTNAKEEGIVQEQTFSVDDIVPRLNIQALNGQPNGPERRYNICEHCGNSTECDSPQSINIITPVYSTGLPAVNTTNPSEVEPNPALSFNLNPDRTHLIKEKDIDSSSENKNTNTETQTNIVDMQRTVTNPSAKPSGPQIISRPGEAGFVLSKLNFEGVQKTRVLNVEETKEEKLTEETQLIRICCVDDEELDELKRELHSKKPKEPIKVPPQNMKGLKEIVHHEEDSDTSSDDYQHKGMPELSPKLTISEQNYQENEIKRFKMENLKIDELAMDKQFPSQNTPSKTDRRSLPCKSKELSQQSYEISDHNYEQCLTTSLKTPNSSKQSKGSRKSVTISPGSITSDHGSDKRNSLEIELKDHGSYAGGSRRGSLGFELKDNYTSYTEQTNNGSNGKKSSKFKRWLGRAKRKYNR